MFKVTRFDTAEEQRLVLEGRLTEPSLAELEAAWEKAQNERGSRRCVVDLNGVTVIDRRAKSILTTMCGEGAQLVALGVATAELTREIACRCAQGRAGRLPGDTPETD